MNLFMFRIAPLALSLLFFPFPLRAEAQDAELFILVVDVVSDDLPLPGASVVVSGRTVISGVDGRAVFDLPSGEYDISAGATGHLPATRHVVLTAQGPAPVLITLSRIPEVEESVIVTATRTNTRLQDQPVRVEVIDREDIEEKALMTPGSVAMLLGETTGLRVQTTSPALGAANVRIQGLRGHYSQLLADGLPLYGAQGDSFSLLQVPPLDLGQVEIIKGAASALYGASALGGVVNLVARRPAEAERELLINATSQSGQDLTSWLANPIGDAASWTLLGGYHRQSAQDLDDDGWLDLPRFERVVVRPRFFADDAAGKNMFATMGFMAEDRDGGTAAAGDAAQRPAIRGIVEDPPRRRRLRGTLACSRQSCAVRSRVVHAALPGSTVRNHSRARRAQHMVWRSLPARRQRAPDMGWRRRISAGQEQGSRIASVRLPILESVAFHAG